MSHYPRTYRWWTDGLLWSFGLAVLLGGIVGAAVTVVIVA